MRKEINKLKNVSSENVRTLFSGVTGKWGESQILKQRRSTAFAKGFNCLRAKIAICSFINKFF